MTGLQNGGHVVNRRRKKFAVHTSEQLVFGDWAKKIPAAWTTYFGSGAGAEYLGQGKVVSKDACFVISGVLEIGHQVASLADVAGKPRRNFAAHTGNIR